MQYYTITNYGDPEGDLIRKSNQLKYRERFNTLEGRLNKKVFQFFKNRTFHDYKLFKFELEHGMNGDKYPINIKILLTSYDLDIWELHFKGVSKLQTNYVEDSFSSGFEDWIYEELLDVDENTLSFEVLFASEASILIHFKNKMLSIRQLK
ncbi:hypothetical protein [Chengkuizengella marina]|uniref:Uncharacterized protein n=1 Tax=Chengkuizengella marina TaxID=2507566 RepID=A0A6N9Q0Z4_9BACL|nr:hypothetical protein [Chengkuizengella marina]NBI28433.1 hypothetical protein [Chengkuizengella marina]